MVTTGAQRAPPADTKCPPAAAAQASEARLYVYILICLLTKHYHVRNRFDTCLMDLCIKIISNLYLFVKVEFDLVS